MTTKPQPHKGEAKVPEIPANEKRPFQDDEFISVKRSKIDIRRVVTWRSSVYETQGLERISDIIETRYGPFPVVSQESNTLHEVVETLLPVAHASGVVCEAIQKALIRLEAIRMHERGTSVEGMNAFQGCLNMRYEDITVERWRSAMKAADQNP